MKKHAPSCYFGRRRSLVPLVQEDFGSYDRLVSSPHPVGPNGLAFAMIAGPFICTSTFVRRSSTDCSDWGTDRGRRADVRGRGGPFFQDSPVGDSAGCALTNAGRGRNSVQPGKTFCLTMTSDQPPAMQSRSFATRCPQEVRTGRRRKPARYRPHLFECLGDRRR